MKILKFGGTSVKSAENILNVIDIITQALSEDRIGVVVSAFGGITDRLKEAGEMAKDGGESYKDVIGEIEDRHVKAVKQLIDIRRQSKIMATVKQLSNELEDVLHGVFLVKELSSKTLDFVMSFGERFSAYIITEAFNDRGVNAECVEVRELIKTDDSFGHAIVQFDETYALIKKHYKNNNHLKIYPGFIGSTSEDETTTLGRGGSDLTASIIAAALGASELQIWTDVDGVMTIDPGKTKKALPVRRLSYAEAMELSHFGAKVIYPPTIQPVYNKNIPIHIKNTFNPKAHGTLISKKSGDGDALIKGISSIDQISLLTLHGSGMIGVAGISMRLFTALAQKNINVILISQASSEHSISFAVDPGAAKIAKKAVEEEFQLEIKAQYIDKVVIESDLSIIAIVGENMKKTRGIAGRLFSALGRNGINVVAIAQGSSELNISFVVEQKDLSKSLSVIHDSFFLSETRDLNLFLIGVGTIGNTLLKQIDSQLDFLSNNLGINVKLIGVTNSKKMLFKQDGIPISEWKEALEKNSTKTDIYKFIDKMIKMNLGNSVFIDCTASAEVADCYKKVMNGSISVVTPNKIANSGKYGYYKDLKILARKMGIGYLYETNVCAGLPIISTLNDLIKSGDKVYRIEAVLSGTLNYIFNTYSKEKPFSEVVKQAQELGYAEPDPRIDLNGVDVLRKILILAREIGVQMEPKEIEVENFLPVACQKAKSLEAFYKELKKVDKDFERQRANLAKKGKKLRYIAVYENGKAYTALKEFDQNHPFYFIEGKDNIVLFSTEHYKEQPMIVKGAGAGAEVTAGGVFADIIRVANIQA